MQAAAFSQAVVDIIGTGKFMAVWACQLDFVDGMVYAHTGTGELTIDGITYQGVGNFGSINNAGEGVSKGSPRSIELTLSGLDTSILNETNLKGCRGRFGRVLFVAIAEDGSYAADILFSGRMDAARFSYKGNAGENIITVPIIDRMAEWQRTGTERWTDQNHRARHGDDDRYFYAIAQLANAPIYWGAKQDSPGFEYS